MSDLTEDLVAASATPVPRGWEPYSEYTDAIGKAIVKLPTPGASERDLLITAGFDPDLWKISGSINTRKWMSFDGEWLYYFKFDVVAGESPEVAELHVADLTKRICRRKAPLQATREGLDAFAFVASDWQVGKAEGGKGTANTVDNVVGAVDAAKRRVRDLRRIGRAMPQGALIGLGDIVENCLGFFAAQPFQVDLNVRDQNKVSRELITYAILELAPLFETFDVACIGGNHGEQRNSDGKTYTNTGDNQDVAVFETVREAFDMSGWNITWHIPQTELSQVVTLGDVPVGITHGHLGTRGVSAQLKAENWWREADFGMQAVREAKILLVGHHHHFSVVTRGARSLIQSPACDPGSQWFTNIAGQASPAGVLTLRFDGQTALGFADMDIYDGR